MSSDDTDARSAHDHAHHGHDHAHHDHDHDHDDEYADDVDDGFGADGALDDVKAQLASIPADVVVSNHAMGLYELAAIHLSAAPPHLADAALAIDALACLVEGLGERIGDHHEVLVDALANIRMAFVQIKGREPA